LVRPIGFAKRKRSGPLRPKIASLVDVLVCDEYAHESCLGIGGNAARSEATEAAPFDALVARASVNLPDVRVFAATLRDQVLASVNRWGAVLWAGGQRLTARYARSPSSTASAGATALYQAWPGHS